MEFHDTQKYLTLFLLCFTFTKVRLKIEDCSHICVGAAQSPLFDLDEVENHLHGLLSDDSFSTLYPFSAQTQSCKPITTPLLFS